MSDHAYELTAGLLGTWSHSGLFLLTVPLFVLCCFSAHRARKAMDHARAAGDRGRARRSRAFLWVSWAFAYASLPAFCAGLFHFGCAMPRSNRMRCLSNVKMLGLELLMYAQDNDDRLPPADGWASAAVRPGDSSALRCPTANTPGSYGMNRAAGGMTIYDPAPNPPLVTLFEADGRVASFAGGPEDVARTRHYRGSNVGFTDGHAAFVGPDRADTLLWEPPAR